MFSQTLEQDADDFLQLIHQAPVGLLQVTADGDIQVMNPMAVNLLMPFVDARPLTNLFEALGPSGADMKARCAASKDSHGVLVEGYRIDASDRTEVNLKGQSLTLGLTLTRSTSGALIVAVNDLSNLVLAEREVMRARAHADAANEAKTRFLAGTSHEIRQPLNAILGFADVIEQQIFGAMPDRYLGYVGHIAEAGRHLQALINDILDLSKVEAGEMSVSLEPLAVATVFKTCTRLLSERAASAGVALTASAPDQMVVLADPLRLKQILVNLVSNGLKFTPAGGRVCLDAAQREGWVVMTITDTGCGIPIEQQKAVFEPYHQAAAANSGDVGSGTGLGLPMARALAEAQGGTLVLNSLPDKGTTVTVTLPSPGGGAQSSGDVGAHA